MHESNARSAEPEGRALHLVGLTVLLVTFLLALAAILARPRHHPAPAVAPEARGEDSAGGGGAVSLVPGAPSPVQPVGTFPDGPGVTIVEDVRETLHRLPLDRNHPKGWTNPSARPDRTGSGSR